MLSFVYRKQGKIFLDSQTHQGLTTLLKMFAARRAVSLRMPSTVLIGRVRLLKPFSTSTSTRPSRIPPRHFPPPPPPPKYTARHAVYPMLLACTGGERDVIVLLVFVCI